MSEYYTESGSPGTGTLGVSIDIRNEFIAIEAGTDKLPALSGNGDKPVFINTAGSGMEAITAASAKTKLGLVIGTNVQAYDASLQSLAALATAADKLAYTTALDTWAETPITSAGRALIDDASNSAQRTTLGSGAVGDAVFIAATAAAARTAIGAVIGTDVQAYDAELAAIAGLTSAADKGIQFTGSGTAGTYDLTTAGRALLDDASNTAQRATLGSTTVGDAVFIAASTAAARTAIDAPSLSVANTFAGTQTIASTSPAINIEETDASAENSKWRLIVNSEILALRTMTDALVNGQDILTVQRTGTTIDSITMPLLTVSGALSSGALSATTIDLSGSLASTKAAETGYSRVTPNMCRLNDTSGATALTRNTITLVTGPTGAKGLIINILVQIYSLNAVGSRFTTTTVYSDSGATTQIAVVHINGYEEVAKVGTLIQSATQEIHVKCNASQQVWLRFTDDVGDSGISNYTIVGYYEN
jgi:hypothetical protein